MAGSRCVVVDENTLCYQQEGDTMLGVLAGKILKGGRHWMSGPFPASCAGTLRPATFADFEDYRVHPAGFMSEGVSEANPLFGIF